MPSYWGSGVLIPLVKEVYAPVPSEYVYDDSRNAGEDNYNLATYGNPIFSENDSTGSYTFFNNYLSISGSGTGYVEFMTTNAPNEQHKYLTIEITYQTGIGDAYLVYNGRHKIILDDNNKFTLDISEMGLYPVGIRLNTITGGSTTIRQISKIYFSD